MVFAAQIQDHVAGLPKDARLALADTLERLAADPWAEPRYHDRLPAEMRTATFGAWGFLTYVIGTKRHVLIVIQVTWAG